VRPTSEEKLPGIALPPHPAKNPNLKSKLFPATRVLPQIDILFEPLSPTSVRFAYVMSQPVPPWMPTWAINFILQNGMAKIFAEMRRVARQMAADDRSSEHVRYTQSEQYAPTRRSLNDMLARAGCG
jgi:hypothetical protein